MKNKFQVAYSVDDLREVLVSAETDQPNHDKTFQKVVSILAGTALAASLGLGLMWYADQTGFDFSADPLQSYASIIDVNGVVETNTTVRVSGEVPEGRIPAESRNMALDVSEQIGATFSGKTFGVIEGLPDNTSLTEMITYDDRHTMTFNNFSNEEDEHVAAAQAVGVTMSAFDSVPDLSTIEATITPTAEGYTVRLETEFATTQQRRTLERVMQILARPSIYQSGMTYELVLKMDKLKYEATSGNIETGNALLEEAKLVGSSVVGASQAGFGGNVIETVFTTNGTSGTSQVVTRSEGTNREEIARSARAFWQAERNAIDDFPLQIQVLAANGSLAYSN